MNRQNLLALVWMLMLAWLPVSAQEYRNPVVPGFHPDPSVCRAGDTFYLVNSSFQYFPGVPIFQSKDMVHWQQIGNVLDRESQIPLKGASSWLGIYAPTIRYHEGTYYMITTNVGNGGNFMVTATDPRGPWSEPVWLKQQGIDPSLYFENGKCYMVSNPGDAIWLCEINPKTGEQLTESKQLWQGDGGRYPEGPHIYKKDGYYYLLISEGGTELPGVPLEKHLEADAEDAPTTGAFEWVQLQNPIPGNYLRNDAMAVDEKFFVRLYPHGTLTENQQPTFVGRRQESASFTLETEVSTKGDVEAGLSVYQINDGHLDFFVSQKQVALRCKLKSIDYVVKSVPRLRKGSVKLRIRSNGEMYFFDYSLDGKKFHELASMNCSLMSTEVAGGFTGVVLGMFAEGKEKSGNADFGYFHYDEK